MGTRPARQHRAATAVTLTLLSRPSPALQGPDAAPPLLQAARSGDEGAAAAALQAGADPNQRGEDGETALHWAADRGHVDVLQLLLQHGADVNAPDADGLTPLHYAALAEQRGSAEKLAAAPGVQLGQRNADGDTPADLAPQSWTFLRACCSGSGVAQPGNVVEAAPAGV